MSTEVIKALNAAERAKLANQTRQTAEMPLLYESGVLLLVLRSLFSQHKTIMSTAPLSPATQTARRHAGRYIYDELRQQILTLKLKPGESLDEISLAERFELSRSPVRDALARLTSEGLVTSLPNRTTIVTPFEIAQFPNYVAALDLIQRAVTRLAAQHCQADDLAKIERANAVYMQAIADDDFHSMAELNKAFHMAIAHAGRNPYFSSCYERLLGEGQRLLHLHFDYIGNTSFISLGSDHEVIIRAIAHQDVEAADHAAHEHTLLFQQRFLQFMQQNLTATMPVAAPNT